MVRIAICDDETTYLRTACTMLEQYAAERDLSFTTEAFSNPSALLDSIEGGCRYDVYLLDIYMPGISGMSAATELRSRDIQSPIVFLTSSTDHAVEAFGVDATHYLLKPYTKENFFAALDKAMQRILEHTEDSIVLKVDNEYQSISIPAILYCEAADKYQRIYLENGETCLVRMTASELYERLKAFGCFHRCGRAYIINLNHLKKVTVSAAVLKNGTELPLSHTAVTGLRTAFFRHFN